MKLKTPYLSKLFLSSLLGNKLKKTSMQKVLLIVLFMITISCNHKKKPNSMYQLLNNEFVYSSKILKVEIAKNLLNDKLINDEIVKSYERLTNEYLIYLRNTYSELIKKK